MYYLKISLVLLYGIVLFKVLNRNLFYSCEVEKCPYCFGTELCKDFSENNIILRSNSLLEFFSNYIGAKNVFYGSYKNQFVVLKKLGHNFELDYLDRNKGDLARVSFNKEVLRLLFSTDANFKVCSILTAQNLLRVLTVKHSINIVHVWTILRINIEPLILQLLKAEDYWPVPTYFGACGRLIVESHCGYNLNAVEHLGWYLRSKLALQLLHAAKNFTQRHEHFRFYLTDISPDNIVVDGNYKLSFIDLENVIIAENVNSDLSVHRSEDFDEDFAFSVTDICSSSISDHNYFAVCKLLLSKDAPWPMMKGGLLHSPPATVVKEHFELFALVESCAHKTNHTNCFDAVDEIIFLLENM